MNTVKRAVLLIDQPSQWALSYAGTYKNLCIQARPFEPFLMGNTVDEGLNQWALGLLHYDLAIVIVSPQNLSWVRRQLHCARRYLRTPILALIKDLQPIAIQDVLDVGATDFIMDYNFQTEIVIRVKLLLQRVQQALRNNPKKVATQSQPTENSVVTDPLLKETTHSLDAYTAAIATRYAAHEQPFQLAKNSVVQRFEKAYIRAALVRNQGNITRAARTAQKHRRSFWELMRKHNIDAEIYRVSACPEQLSIR